MTDSNPPKQLPPTQQAELETLLHTMTCGSKPHPTNYDYFCEYRDVLIPETAKKLQAAATQRAIEAQKDVLIQIDPYIDPEFRELFEQLRAQLGGGK